MIEIAKQTIDFFIKTGKKPRFLDLKIENENDLKNRWSLFVTIYHKWEIRGSAWNIKEIENSIAEEIIENTIFAISKDPRFKPISPKEANEIKIRIDKITRRDLLKNKSIAQVEPTKVWIIAIKNDYSKMAAILPNINPKIINWEDFIPVIKEKLKEKDFKEKNYIIYEIETEVETSF